MGLFARLVDAGFDVSLLVRGRVPGGTAAAAEVKYRASQIRDPRFVYYGRVIRQGGWIVLHYLYFYWMNDWRSSFYGANDHEADLEQAYVVLEEDTERPMWFGCAAHDYTGDELRRRWDDPTLQRNGDHPVIFAGAGSHAAYFEGGEYVTGVPLPALAPVHSALEGLRVFWRDVLHQPDPGDLAATLESAFTIPFIDYARGDGQVIGVDGATWEARIVGDETPWVHGFRGLWGLDTRDRFGGERAPAGLRYTRDGTVRTSWNDPLGFLGLTKVPPPGRRLSILQARIGELEAERAKVLVDIEQARDRLPALEVETQAVARSGALAAVYAERSEELLTQEAALAAAEAHRAQLDDTLEAASAELERIRTGDLGDPRAHLRLADANRPEHPRPLGWLVEAWSAISASALLVGIVLLLYFTDAPVWFAVGLALAAFAVLEAVLRQRLTSLLLRVTSFLAVIAVILLFFAHIEIVLVVAVIAVAALTLVANLREVAGR